MTIAQKILELRKKCNMTQEELADVLKVSRQTVSKWETGISIPDTYNLVEISKIFNVSLDYLIGSGQAVDNEKRSFRLQWFEIMLLSIGAIGMIAFGILLFIDIIPSNSSVITINGYGLYFIFSLAIFITITVIIIKRFNEKK